MHCAPKRGAAAGFTGIGKLFTQARRGLFKSDVLSLKRGAGLFTPFCASGLWNFVNARSASRFRSQAQGTGRLSKNYVRQLAKGVQFFFKPLALALPFYSKA